MEQNHIDEAIACLKRGTVIGEKKDTCIGEELWSNLF